jgi:Xaa-Pro aminopeptidase
MIHPGHVYTDEAGYRHSDTVAVTDDGLDFLTHYPRDFDSNVVDA